MIMNNGYSRSQKGKVVLVKDYYTYHENCIYKETTSGSHCRVRVYWKCAMAGCQGTALTYRTTELEDSDFSNGQNHSLPFHDHKEPKELFKVWDADVKVNGDKAQATMNQYPVVNTEKKLHAEIHELIANQVNQPAKMEIDMDGLSQCSELPDEFFSSTDDIVEGGVKRKREEDLEVTEQNKAQHKLSCYTCDAHNQPLTTCHLPITQRTKRDTMSDYKGNFLITKRKVRWPCSRW